MHVLHPSGEALNYKLYVVDILAQLQEMELCNFQDILQGIASDVMDSNLFQLKSSTFHETYRWVPIFSKKKSTWIDINV